MLLLSFDSDYIFSDFFSVDFVVVVVVVVLRLPLLLSALGARFYRDYIGCAISGCSSQQLQL